MRSRVLLRFLALCGLLLADIFFSRPAGAEETLELQDAGRTQTFAIAPDEVHVRREGAAAGEVAARVKAQAAGATVLEEIEDRAIVQLPPALQRDSAARQAIAARTALAGMEVAPVLYPAGLKRDERSRRIATQDVLVRLKSGETAETVRAASGAATARKTAAAGLVMLKFSDGYAALAAAQNLRTRGYGAHPQLARKMSLRAAPNDPFFGQQWHLRNVGQKNGKVGIDVNPVRAWDFDTGSGVVIAIVDDCLQLSHPDLAPNVLPLTLPGTSVHPHHDFNGNDDNPSPGANDAHGTSCAGVAAARFNNNEGGSGSAPQASLLGLRLISNYFTDEQSASALFWRPQGVTISVSSNSWGPYDDGHLEGPGPLTRQALQDAATTGRGGKGVIFCWAGGNGLQNSDTVALDGFASSKFVLAVAALTNLGRRAYYSESGSALAVTAPSSGGTIDIFTTDITATGGYNPGAGEPSNQNYTNSFGGTSSATPLVSGCVAVLLQARPDLSYRDVKEILMSSAKKIDITDTEWLENSAGFHFNHKHGAGLPDLTAALALANEWTPLAAEQVLTRALGAPNIPAPITEGNTGITRSFDFSNSPNLRVEHVEVVLKITHPHRSDLDILLTSPSGMTSLLVDQRPRPSASVDNDANYSDGNAGWTFMSTRHWGEDSAGTWTVRLRDRRTGSTGTLDTAAVKIYGTPETTQRRVVFENGSDSASETGSPIKAVRVKRLGDLSGPVSVDYAVSAVGTATNDDSGDFTLAAGTLEFADQQQFATISVPIHDDLEQEPAETVVLVLKNPVGAALGAQPVITVTINDDDGNGVTIAATDPSAAETNQGQIPDNGTFTFSRTSADPTPLLVHFSVSGTATNGVDYNTIGSTVTIPAFATTATVSVVPKNDGAIEGAETVVLTIDPATANEYQVGVPSSAVVTIYDNDKPQVSITAAVSSVREDAQQPVNFVVSRSAGDTTATLTVKLLTLGNAVSGLDYVELPSQVEIPAGSTSVNVPLQVKNNTNYKANRTVSLRIVTTEDYTEGLNILASISIIEDDPVPDSTAPTVKITSPSKNASIHTPAAVNATGTAADNVQLKRVLYYLNDGPQQQASGTTSWSANLTANVVPGPNTLLVQSEDVDGNLSKPAQIAFNYIVPRTLKVSIKTNGSASAGGGQVSRGFTPQISLEAGRKYQITATPNSGFVFANWSGDLASPSQPFVFTMPDFDAQLVANFVSDPFIGGVPGTYTGIARAADLAVESSGLLQVTINARGLCTGRLSFGEAKFSFKGAFNGEGRYVGTLARKGAAPLTLDLNVALTGSTRQVTGSISTPDFSAALLAERAGFSKSAPYALLATHPKGETYNFILPPPTASAAGDPLGAGYGSCKIDAHGTVKWSAILADGSKVTGAAPLSKDLHWALHASLAKGKEVILGTETINKGTTPAELTGDAAWAKISVIDDKIFAAGFSLDGLALKGSLYTPPLNGSTNTAFALAPKSGTVTIGDGSLNAPAPFERSFSINSANQVTVSNLGSPNISLAFKVDAKKGTFSGTFIDPKFTTKPETLKFAGVILQSTHEGGGGFIGDTLSHTNVQSGSVRLKFAP